MSRFHGICGRTIIACKVTHLAPTVVPAAIRHPSPTRLTMVKNETRLLQMDRAAARRVARLHGLISANLKPLLLLLLEE